jgi:predicted site-specific integrase-resolvase
MKLYTQTTGSAARAAGLSAATLANYAKAGLIESVRAANGQILLPDDAAEQAREIFAERKARRGRTCRE